jgi:peptide/nickel transport system permease protein
MLRLCIRSLTLLLALSLFTFLLSEWSPGDFLSGLEASPEYSQSTAAVARQRLALDRPVGERYLSWLHSAITGDFGISHAYSMPASELIRPRLWNTFRLNLTATTAAWIMAFWLGSWAAARRGGRLDAGLRQIFALLLGLPEILLALFGLWLFGSSPLLPYAVLALGALPTLAIHIRYSVGGALEHDAVRAARAYRITGVRLWWSYVFPLAAPPLISLAGISFGALFSASLLVEAALGYPGLGSLVLDSIQTRDTAVVAAAVALSGILLMAANLSADLARRALDPKLRSR